MPTRLSKSREKTIQNSPNINSNNDNSNTIIDSTLELAKDDIKCTETSQNSQNMPHNGKKIASDDAISISTDDDEMVVINGVGNTTDTFAFLTYTSLNTSDQYNKSALQLLQDRILELENDCAVEVRTHPKWGIRKMKKWRSQVKTATVVKDLINLVIDYSHYMKQSIQY